MDDTSKLLGLVTHSRLFGLLALVFMDSPDGPDTAAIRSECEVVSDLLGMMGNPIANGQALVAEIRRQAAADNLRGLYPRTFGHVPAGSLSPYETSYLGASTFSQSQTLADIAGFYLAFGARPSSEFAERPDHLGPELEFLALLNHKEALARDDGRLEDALICEEARRRFVEEHAGRWVPVVFDRIGKSAAGECYLAAASLGKLAVNREIELLGIQGISPDLAPPPTERIAEEHAPDIFGCGAAPATDQDYELF